MMYIGMNNYELYDSKWCDGHPCPRDCERCPYGEENIMEEDEEEER